MLRLPIFLAVAAAVAWMQTADPRPVQAASPTTLLELVSAIRANARALEGSTGMKSGFQTFTSKFALQPGTVSYSITR